MTNNDSLGLCPKCSCDGCYITPINEAKNAYFCFGCGFQTNDLMVEGEFDFEQYEETLPELYKDILSIQMKIRESGILQVLICQRKGRCF